MTRKFWKSTAGVMALAAGALFTPSVAFANPQLASIEGARANMEVLPQRLVRAEGFEYDHAVSIALPASYRVSPDRKYPVLWVLDDPLMMRTVTGLVDLLVSGNMVPEMIVIGVGSPADEGLAGVGKRIVEFSPAGDGFFPEGPAADIAPIYDYPQRADDFLAFLIDDLRPAMATEFRMSGEHVLHGHSLGGMLGAYTLFTRPGSFDAMILGSPALANVDGAVFKAESAYDAAHDELPAKVFLGVGGGEAGRWFLAASHIVSSTARFAEELAISDYHGLQVESRFYTGEDHYTSAPRTIVDGLRWVFREEAAGLGSTWPQRP